LDSAGARWRREGVNVRRLTARISRLETRDGARWRDDEHLSEAELEARICRAAEQLTTQWRNGGMSVAAIVADTGWSADDPRLAPLLVEVQAPAFDAARYLAAVRLPK